MCSYRRPSLYPHIETVATHTSYGREVLLLWSRLHWFMLFFGANADYWLARTERRPGLHWSSLADTYWSRWGCDRVVIPGSGLEICLSLELILMPVLPVAVLGTGYLSSIFLLASRCSHTEMVYVRPSVQGLVILPCFVLSYFSTICHYGAMVYYSLLLLWPFLAFWISFLLMFLNASICILFLHFDFIV